MTTPSQAFELLEAATEAWQQALKHHRLAPPDAGFAHRLAEFARAARQQQHAFGAVADAGLGWKPLRGAGQHILPAELRPDSGRRGPADLWETFDSAIARRASALEGTSPAAVATAFADVAQALADLSTTVAAHDGLPIPPDILDSTSPAVRKRLRQQPKRAAS